MADIIRPRRRRKHSRARTGCLTCRTRRIKCDERKPTCSRCRIGSRECSYPSMLDPIRLSSFHQPAPAYTGARPSSSGSELSFDHEEQNEGVVLFQSSTGAGMDQGWSTDRLSFYESLFPLAPETPPSLYHCQHSPRPELSVIPRSPKSNQSQAIEFFLKYHQREIVPALYFKSYDYQHFFKGWLPAMAAQSDALQHSLVSFSALIYSMKVNPAARYTAFYYYSVALKELCLLLNEESMTPTECNVAIATAMQLATIDAHSINSIADGVARILQAFSTSLRQSATMLGRSLLEWYCNFEVYCCLLFARKLLLPRIWRYENVRERQRLADLDYYRLAPNERKPRILDDVWPQLSALFPQLIDIFVGIPSLKALDGSRRSNVLARLNQQLRQFDKDLQELMNSPLVKEVLREAEPPFTFRSHHTGCCPPLPFVPYIFQFPPAGYLRLEMFSVRTYLRAIIYPLLRAEGACGPGVSEFESTDKAVASASAYEQCRSFAGVEAAFGDNQDNLFTCLSPLPMAGMSCAPEIRMWLWYKLAHFEDLCQFSLDPIKKHLAVWWDMPSLATEGFGSWKWEPPEQQIRVLSVEDIDIATHVAKLEIEDRITGGTEPEGKEF